MKWERFSVLHSHDEHSLAVVKSLSQRAASSPTPCIVRIDAIPTSDREDVTATHKLRSLLADLEPSAAIVVVASPAAVESLADALAAESPRRQRQWLFAWVPSEDALERLGVLLNAAGVYALAPYPASVSSFEEHWSNLADVSDAGKAQDHWYLDLVAHQKRCRVQGLR